MIRKHLPQQRKNTLVGKDRLPWRLDPARRRLCEPLAKLIVKHPFPRIEFEQKLDRTTVGIDEAAVVAPTDVLDIDQCGSKAGLPRGVLEISQRAGILLVFGGSREMKVGSLADFFPRLNQVIMDRIELVGMGGNDAPLDRLLEPCPLKDRRLEDRGRCIRVVFQEFRWTAPVKTEVEPAIEAGFVAVPAFGDQRPECFGYFQSA